MIEARQDATGKTHPVKISEKRRIWLKGWRKQYYQKHAAKFRAVAMAYHHKNREAILPKMRARNARNPYRNFTEEVKQKRRASNRKWWLKNIDRERNRSKEKGRKAYAEQKEKILSKNRVYWLKNQDKIRARQRQYRLENLERKRRQVREYHRAKRADLNFKKKHSLRGRAYYQKNKTTIRKKHEKWRRLHPEWQIHHQHKRRALENSAAINPAGIKAWVRSVKLKRFAVCYYCKARVPTTAIHFDHMVALSKGGAHSVENLCVSCATCNLSKGTQKFDEMQISGQALLAL